MHQTDHKTKGNIVVTYKTCHNCYARNLSSWWNAHGRCPSCNGL